MRAWLRAAACALGLAGCLPAEPGAGCLADEECEGAHVCRSGRCLAPDAGEEDAGAPDADARPPGDAARDRDLGVSPDADARPPGDAARDRDLGVSPDADARPPGDAARDRDLGVSPDAAPDASLAPPDASPCGGGPVNACGGCDPLAPGHCCPAEAGDTPGVQRQTCRFALLESAGGGEFTLDVYTADGVARAPVALYLPSEGGGAAHRREAAPMLWRWAAAGVVGVAADYRLRPGGAPIGNRAEAYFAWDAVAALIWVAQNVARYGGDPAHTVVVGNERGAFTALLLTADSAWLTQGFDEVGAAPLAPAGVVGLTALTDLRDPRLNVAEELFVAALFGQRTHVDLSPITWLRERGESPPILLVTGGPPAESAAVTYSSIDYVRAAQAHGVRATYAQPILRGAAGVDDAWCYTYIRRTDVLGLQNTGRAQPNPLQVYFAGSLDRDELLACAINGVPERPVAHPEYAALVERFVRAPDSPLAWSLDGVPGFSHATIPDTTPSPRRFNLGGGALPGEPGEAWAAPDELEMQGGARRLTHVNPAEPRVDAAGQPVPAEVYHFQWMSPTSLRLPAEPGSHTLRLHFAHLPPGLELDVVVEGLGRQTIAPRTGAFADVVELSGADPGEDGRLDVRFEAHAGGPQPRVAGVEIVPE